MTFHLLNQIVHCHLLSSLSNTRLSCFECFYAFLKTDQLKMQTPPFSAKLILVLIISLSFGLEFRSRKNLHLKWLY